VGFLFWGCDLSFFFFFSLPVARALTRSNATPPKPQNKTTGNPNLDFDALERNAKYDGGFSASSPACQWLWSIVRADFSLEEKKLFLKFFTGSDRAPIGGLGALRIVVQRDGPDGPKLPTSHTCFNTLLLPDYASRAKMADRLRLAIVNGEGFGLE
jgi:hypothetical protein